jgi:ring-1,2-phenylacetyl-CoA epoxidase subunit PaaE
MASSTRHILRHLGVSDSRIEAEVFGGRPDASQTADDTVDSEVRFERSKRTVIVPGARTILDAALLAGVPLDHGCRAGVCGRCRARLLDGEVTIDCDFALTPEQRAAGIILSCQAHPRGPVVIDC